MTFLSQINRFREPSFFSAVSKLSKNIEREAKNKKIDADKADFFLNQIQNLKTTVFQQKDPLISSCQINQITAQVRLLLKNLDKGDKKDELLEKIDRLFYQSFNLIPNEILSHIFSFLKIVEAMKMTYVNRRFNFLVSNQPGFQKAASKIRSEWLSKKIDALFKIKCFKPVEGFRVHGLMLIIDSIHLKLIFRINGYVLNYFNYLVIVPTKNRLDLDREIQKKKIMIALQKGIAGNYNDAVQMFASNIQKCRSELLKNKESYTLDFDQDGRDLDEPRNMNYDELTRVVSELRRMDAVSNHLFYQSIDNIQKTKFEIVRLKKEKHKIDDEDMPKFLEEVLSFLNPFSHLKNICTYVDSEKLRRSYLLIRQSHLTKMLSREISGCKKNKPFEEKMNTLNQIALAFARQDSQEGMRSVALLGNAIKTKIYQIVEEYQETNRALDINNLKNRKFSKKVHQDFCPNCASMFIAAKQREDTNFELQKLQLKSDSLNCLCITLLKATEDVRNLILIKRKLKIITPIPGQQERLFDLAKVYLKQGRNAGRLALQKLNQSDQNCVLDEYAEIRLKTTYCLDALSQFSIDHFVKAHQEALHSRMLSEMTRVQAVHAIWKAIRGTIQKSI